MVVLISPSREEFREVEAGHFQGKAALTESAAAVGNNLFSSKEN
jgi:hypothetical protein